jgi:hypothetical protein
MKLKVLALTIGLFAALHPADARRVAAVSHSGPLPLACDSDVVLSGGFFRLDLPAAAELEDGCDIVIINNDDDAGKVLLSFPRDINPKLYPKQAVGITTLGGNWIAKSKPGRYLLTRETKVLVDNNGDDANDGISLPLQHITTAGTTIETDFDTQLKLAVIAPTLGQTFTEDSLQLGGQPTGSNLIALAPNGDGGITLVNSGPCVIGADNAELYLWANKFGPNGRIDFYCNRSNTPLTGHIYAHNNFLFDGSGKLVFHGAGSNDNAIFMDGPTPGSSITDGIEIAGTFDTIWRMDEGGGRYTLGCGKPGCHSITPVLDEKQVPPSANRMFMILGSEQLLLGGCPYSGGYASLGPSIIAGNGSLVTFGCAIPGGVITSQNGGVWPTKY